MTLTAAEVGFLRKGARRAGDGVTYLLVNQAT